MVKSQQSSILIPVLVATTILITAGFALGLFDGNTPHMVESKGFGEFAFSGEMRDGLFHGYGALSFIGGEMYRGYFAQGRFEGEGTLYGSLDAREQTFVGRFHSGQVLTGVLHSPLALEGIAIDQRAKTVAIATAAWSYHGGFGERGQTGTGIFIFGEGLVYNGSFALGLAEGEGTLSDATGATIYRGGFRGGLFDGVGRYYSQDGWHFEGDFQEGYIHGEGELTMGETSIRGIWERGVQVRRYE